MLHSLTGCARTYVRQVNWPQLFHLHGFTEELQNLLAGFASNKETVAVAAGFRTAAGRVRFWARALK